MRAEIRDTFGGRDVLFKELTLKEIRQWVASVTADAEAAKNSDLPGLAVDVATTLLFDDFDVGDIVLLTDLVDDDLGSFTPEELAAIHARCKTVNARFFVMRDRLVEIGRAAADAIPKTSS